MDNKELESRIEELEKLLAESEAEKIKFEKSYLDQKTRAEKAEKKQPDIPDIDSLLNEKIMISDKKREYLEKGIPLELVNQFITSKDSVIPESLMTPYVNPVIPEPKTKDNSNQPKMENLELDLFEGE